jgi:threonine aldolase
MSFGATKNGAIGCEAVLLFGQARKFAPDLMARAKRAGHMPPKMRFLGAQMAAYLKDGLWLDLARRANASARALADALVGVGGELAHPVDGNEVFCRLPPGAADRLTAAGAAFYPWADGSHRFVCSWATPESDILRAAKTIVSP